MSELSNLAITVTFGRGTATVSIVNDAVTCETTFPDTHVEFIRALDRLADMYRTSLNASKVSEKDALLTSIQGKVTAEEWALIQRL